MKRFVHCYAEGRPGQWEAFCLDFDLAVQGTSYQDVEAKLRNQIQLFLESVYDLPEADRQRLLNRSAPISMYARVMWRVLSAIWNRSANRKQRADFDCPLDGAALAA